MLKRMLRHIASRRSNALLLEDKFGGSTVSKKWAITDTGSSLSVAAGELVCAGGTGSFGDPQLLSVRNWPRALIPTLDFEVRFTDISLVGRMGITDSTGGDAYWVYVSGSNLIVAIAGSNVLSFSSAFIANDAGYRFRIVPKATGVLIYMSRDSGLTYGLLCEDSADATALLAACYQGRTLSFKSKDAKVFRSIPKPAVIDATAAAPTLAYGTDLLASLNGNMESWASATNADNWTEIIGGTSTVNREATDIHSGTYAARFDVDGSNSEVRLRQSGVRTVGSWYRDRVWAKSSVAGVNKLSIGDVASLFGITLTTDYAEYTVVFRGADTRVSLDRGSNGTSNSIYVDDYTVEPITLSSMLSGGGDPGTKYGIHDAACTVTANYHAGVVACLDSAATPLYYLYGYVDRYSNKAYLLKVENGTTTALTNGDITYGAANKVRISVVPGTSGVTNARVHLFYNGTVVGTEQTVDLTSYGQLVRAWRTNESDTVAITSQIGIGI